MRSLTGELRQAAEELGRALGQGGVSDPLKLPWALIDPPFQKLLGGPFDPVNTAHRRLALGLTALVGERLVESGAFFWFPLRDAVGGASLGSPDAVFTVSPGTLASAALW